uniref:Amino acid permease/ SLC12A domain-containing protein n=1 Tax=Clastoptera arizonana TaxID=38151 RepID=A0A1B6CZX9_9HEMI
MSHLNLPKLSIGLSRLSLPRLSIARLSIDKISNFLLGKCTIQMKRELSLVSTVNLIVNGIIGSGIFVTPGIVLAHSGSIAMSLVIWSICGVISVLGALAFAELGIVVPSSGGQYAYFQAAFRDLHPFFGPITGFIFVWMNVLIVYPATLAIQVLTFSDYVYEPIRAIFDADIKGEQEILAKKLITILAIGMMGYINFVSVKLYVRVQNLFSFIKISICFLVVGGAIYVTYTGQSNKMDLGFEGTDYSIKAITMAFYSGLYTFDGWYIVTGVTEEIKKPDKNILRSILIAVPMVTGLYLSVNVAYLTMLTVPQMISEPAVAVAFGGMVFGKWKILISMGVAMSSFGSGLCNVFAASRLCYVAAREGHMIEFFSYIHIDRLTPTPAIALQVVLTFFFLISGDIISLINFSNFLLWIFYGLTMVTVFVLRKKETRCKQALQSPIDNSIYSCFYISGASNHSISNTATSAIYFCFNTNRHRNGHLPSICIHTKKITWNG